jgi:hypothetical protein
MVKVTIARMQGRSVVTTILFVCPTVERAKEIVNEGGHVLGRNEKVDLHTGWTEWTYNHGPSEFTAIVADEPNARYMISEVEYKE